MPLAKHDRPAPAGDWLAHCGGAGDDSDISDAGNVRVTTDSEEGADGENGTAQDGAAATMPKPARPAPPPPTSHKGDGATEGGGGGHDDETDDAGDMEADGQQDDAGDGGEDDDGAEEGADEGTDDGAEEGAEEGADDGAEEGDGDDGDGSAASGHRRKSRKRRVLKLPPARALTASGDVRCVLVCLCICVPHRPSVSF